ncbi:MAG: hypothetical protein IPL11_03810 [Candidatus Accumulibacter sp.]|nr:hypothetical protein [Accumulibacter sp.]
MIAIMKSEKANIDSARLVVTPTVNHDVVQQALYREHVPDYEAYIPKPLVNYIHDEYLDFIPFAEREFDLLFLGRPQVLRRVRRTARSGCQFAATEVCNRQNGENELTEKFKALANTTVYLNLDKSETYERLRNAKSFIDLSVHHNCSTVLLEAINAKTPGVLRQMNTYDEILGREELSNLYLFLSDDDINDKNRAITMIVAHLSELERLSESSDSDFLFNRFCWKTMSNTTSSISRFSLNGRFPERPTVHRHSTTTTSLEKGWSMLSIALRWQTATAGSSTVST